MWKFYELVSIILCATYVVVETPFCGCKSNSHYRILRIPDLLNVKVKSDEVLEGWVEGAGWCRIKCTIAKFETKIFQLVRRPNVLRKIEKLNGLCFETANILLITLRDEKSSSFLAGFQRKSVRLGLIEGNVLGCAFKFSLWIQAQIHQSKIIGPKSWVPVHESEPKSINPSP